jgi:hypothetical protein
MTYENTGSASFQDHFCPVNTTEYIVGDKKEHSLNVAKVLNVAKASPSNTKCVANTYPRKRLISEVGRYGNDIRVTYVVPNSRFNLGVDTNGHMNSDKCFQSRFNSRNFHKVFCPSGSNSNFRKDYHARKGTMKSSVNSQFASHNVSQPEIVSNKMIPSRFNSKVHEDFEEDSHTLCNSAMILSDSQNVSKGDRPLTYLATTENSSKGVTSFPKREFGKAQFSELDMDEYFPEVKAVEIPGMAESSSLMSSDSHVNRYKGKLHKAYIHAEICPLRKCEKFRRKWPLSNSKCICQDHSQETLEVNTVIAPLHFVILEIEDRKIPFLIDTGAQVTIMNENLSGEVPLTSELILQCIQGTKLKCEGIVMITLLQFDQVVDVYFVLVLVITYWVTIFFLKQI